MAITTYPMAAIATLVALIIASCPGGTTAASASTPPAPGKPAPAPAVSECFRALVNTSDCLTYVEVGSNLTKPEKGCCPEVAGLIESNPICLCELLSHPEAIGIKIDVNKALKLPSDCGMSNKSTPTIASCSAEGVPVSLAPSSEDSIAPSDQPREGPASSPSEEAANSSSTENKDNGASSIQASTLLFIFVFAITFLISLCS
ncbi:xylogen-like protein 11 isoform X2 [Senna tora]|uniref:Xylogen-like protein 11 isoform X2 n=1 Tax=Senna tora TaxID=362788 RepID=A0A834W9N0_9FABA|nr:xylogen-like protein 11 isoform X2 [Senna tora]